MAIMKPDTTRRHFLFWAGALGGSRVFPLFGASLPGTIPRSQSAGIDPLQIAAVEQSGSHKTAGAFRAEVIIRLSDASWESRQVQEPCILQNPRDHDKLIMLYAGVSTSAPLVTAVGKAWA